MTVVTHDQLTTTIRAAFEAAGLSAEKAQTCATIHADSTCDGVLSHGLNRVPRFADYLHREMIDPAAEPVLDHAAGAIEIWDGRRGVGITNALHATDRAMALAAVHGIGMVGLRNTTHWMRGGTYGWKAAEAGYAFICWTNTEAVMPSWGAAEANVGNNPMVMAVPRKAGPMVLDMAMSQFSYGKLETTRLQGRQLPVDGGFDSEGNLTRDPESIEKTRRILPTGYWKGSGLSILLDALSVMLTGGTPTNRLNPADDGSCGGCSQVFIAFDPSKAGGVSDVEVAIDSIAQSIAAARPAEHGRPATYPGETTVRRREAARQNGVVVDDLVWQQVVALAER